MVNTRICLRLVFRAKYLCINSKKLKFEYLEQVSLITHYIDYMDFLSEEPLDDFYELIYTKNATKHK